MQRPRHIARCRGRSRTPGGLGAPAPSPPWPKLKAPNQSACSGSPSCSSNTHAARPLIIALQCWLGRLHGPASNPPNNGLHHTPRALAAARADGWLLWEAGPRARSIQRCARLADRQHERCDLAHRSPARTPEARRALSGGVRPGCAVRRGLPPRACCRRAAAALGWADEASAAALGNAMPALGRVVTALRSCLASQPA
jgi:hypothetical protein